MRAEELMRLDWVCLEDDPTPRQVDWIRSGEVGLLWNKTVTPPYLEPIPLTPDILEKNGFECKHKGEALKRLYWILNVEGGSVKVKINRGLFLFNIFGVPFQHGFYTPSVNKHIQYVHELQHALKLCGIDKEIEL